MQPRSGSASEFILLTLRQHADRELRVADLVELGAGQFKLANIQMSLRLLLEHGEIIRTKDGAEAWWAINLAGPDSAEPVKAVVMPVEVNVIRSGRW